jgi:uncharacterized lipoprotein YmbA
MNPRQCCLPPDRLARTSARARRLACAGIGLCFALIVGCASSPPSRFYTLSGAAAQPQPEASPTVVVGPVSIPAVVDRPEIVVTIGDNEVWLDEFNRWAAPLADNIALAVAENLAAALRTSRVTLLAQAAGAESDYRVAVEVQRFESAPGNYALLDALFTVRRVKDGLAATGRTTAREALADRGYDALAAAHSRLLAQLSRDVAAAVGGLTAVPPVVRAAPSPAR